MCALLTSNQKLNEKERNLINQDPQKKKKITLNNRLPFIIMFFYQCDIATDTKKNLLLKTLL